MLHTKGATEETLLKTSQECRPHPKAGVPRETEMPGTPKTAQTCRLWAD